MSSLSLANYVSSVTRHSITLSNGILNQAQNLYPDRQYLLPFLVPIQGYF